MSHMGANKQKRKGNGGGAGASGSPRWGSGRSEGCPFIPRRTPNFAFQLTLVATILFMSITGKRGSFQTMNMQLGQTSLRLLLPESRYASLAGKTIDQILNLLHRSNAENFEPLFHHHFPFSTLELVDKRHRKQRGFRPNLRSP